MPYVIVVFSSNLIAVTVFFVLTIYLFQDIIINYNTFFSFQIISITKKSLLRLLIKIHYLKEHVNSDMIEHNMNNFYLANQEIYCRHNCIFSGT